jgi:coenzyme F420-reducing hydrogenase alpha subunit
MGEEIDEGLVNLLEMVVRCYDCWLSCAAHITVTDEEGNEVYSRKLNVGTGWSIQYK